MDMNRARAIAGAAACAACIAVQAQAPLDGKWQGATPSGREVVLDVKTKGQQLTGTLSLGPQSAEIAEGKVDGKSFSFKATLDDRTVTFTGQVAGDQIELTPQEAARPVTLKRVK
jgi:hypothetical protein